MNTIYKTKSQLRTETADALAKFLKAGGTIEVVKSRKAPKQKMKAVGTRQASTGTGGFATGFPRKSTVGA
jgi:hypothetical protein